MILRRRRQAMHRLAKTPPDLVLYDRRGCASEALPGSASTDAGRDFAIEFLGLLRCVAV